MNFALTRLSNGGNITDMTTLETSALGSGELARIVTDMGEALRRTLEATLVGMKPYQSIEVVIMVLPEAGFKFVGPGQGKHRIGAMDKVRFALLGGDDDLGDVDIIQPKKKTNKNDNVLDETKSIIVLQGGKGGIVNLNQDKNIYGTIAGDILDEDPDPEDNDDFKQ
jgi:hypothetical protein